MRKGFLDCMVAIKNGYLARRSSVKVRYSNMNLSGLELLEREGFISYKTRIDDYFFYVKLKNSELIRNKFKSWRIVSTPTVKYDVSVRTLRYLKKYLDSELIMLSIPVSERSIVSLEEALKLNKGGELLISFSPSIMRRLHFKRRKRNYK